MPAQVTPDTIVLIHGFWMTPRSWEHWKARYEAKATAPHAGLPRLRGRGRGAERRPDPDRGGDGPEIIDAPRVGSRARRPRRSSWATRPAAPSPSSCSTAASAPPASPSTPRRRRACWWRPVAAQADLPGAENPANRHRAVGFTPSSSSTRSRTPSTRTCPAPRTSATTSPRTAASCGTASSPT